MKLEDRELAQALKIVRDRALEYASRFEDGVTTMTFKFRFDKREFDIDRMALGAVMTISDLAAFLHVDTATVRRMLTARAQHSSVHRLPFFKLNGKNVRFRRDDILEWLASHPNASIRPLKGKKTKVRIRVTS